VTGGYVYRGSVMPGLVGNYVFGDFVSGRIWRLVDDGSGGYTADELIDSAYLVASFAEDQNGELYVVDHGGQIFRIDDGGGLGVDPNPLPDLLSQTGCFTPANPSAPAAGLVPYSVAAPFWSDGADKERWMAIPNGTTIGIAADGDFLYPNGTVLAKHFRLDGALIETRLFMRHPDGAWAGYTYEWNAQETDAAIVIGGKTVNISGQDWLFPDANQCLTCHTAAAGFSLGLEVGQLNGDHLYPTGRTANQLATLDAVRMFASVFGNPNVQPALPDLTAAGGSLDDRARAYLHTNCAQCHQPGGPTPVQIDLRYSTALAGTGTCGVQPQSGELGIQNAAIVAPGAPDRSVLLERIIRRGDPAQMPPLATFLPDANGITLIRDWISSLVAC
jgi:uncharacterized repeat protein (TIGR03806 family)